MDNCELCGNRIKIRTKAKTSYGFILIKIVNRKLKVLLIQRKYTISFSAFVLGKYKLYDFNHILEMFYTMTPDEKQIIAKESFEQLWNRIWSYTNEISKRPCLQKKYQISLHRYNILRESEELHNLDYLVKTKSRIDNPDWCFPKGRKDYNNHESSLNCAFREVKEETGLDSNDFIHLNLIRPVDERYIGTDSLLYKCVYYIGLITTKKNICLDSTNEYQRSEVGDIGLFTISEALTCMRSNPRRKEKIFRTLLDIIENKYPYIIQGVNIF